VVHDHRFDELAAGFLERPGGDCQTLLGYGLVTLEPVPDPEGWRKEIRRQGRRDLGTGFEPTEQRASKQVFGHRHLYRRGRC
jgi:hypothetical protein